MVIHDSDPERRNLVVASLAFIIFFYAGGSFPESSVRLQVINANFTKPEVLSYIAWCIFGWFIYRYWLTHRGNFASGFANELNEWRIKRYITNYINKYFGQELRPNVSTSEYLATSMGWSSGKVVVTCSYQSVRRDINGKVSVVSSQSDNNGKPTKYIKLTSLKGWVLATRATFGCILSKPSFSNYLVPYILAVIAIVGAIYH